MPPLALPFLAAAAAVMLAPADARAGSPGGVFSHVSAETRDLAAYRWKNRPVLIFAPSPKDPAFLEQEAALAAATDGLLERDIVVLVDAAPDAAGALRRTFRPRGFEVLLVGKDGDVKLRRSEPIDAEVLFARIDSMPMRRREMTE